MQNEETHRQRFSLRRQGPCLPAYVQAGPDSGRPGASARAPAKQVNFSSILHSTFIILHFL